MATETVAARARDLVKIYGKNDAEVFALNGVSLDIYAGEFTAVMGPSGSGKSTFMHCMAALDVPTEGAVFIGDTDVSDLNDVELTELRRDEVGFIFQSFNLLPTLTAKENILLPLSIAGREPDPEWFDQVIDAVGLSTRLDHTPTELSGGQQQRVACARALVSRPSIVFADEPTGNLDSVSGTEVLRFLRHSVEEFGQTIVMVTHDAVAASYTDRVVFLADGQFVDEMRNPTTEDVLDHMSELQQKLSAKAEAKATAEEEEWAKADAELKLKSQEAEQAEAEASREAAAAAAAREQAKKDKAAARAKEKERTEAEAERRRAAVEAERQRKAEAAEQRRIAAEAERQRMAEEADRKADEAQRKRKAEAAERKRKAEEALQVAIAAEAASIGSMTSEVESLPATTETQTDVAASSASTEQAPAVPRRRRGGDHLARRPGLLSRREPAEKPAEDQPSDVENATIFTAEDTRALRESKESESVSAGRRVAIVVDEEPFEPIDQAIESHDAEVESEVEDDKDLLEKKYAAYDLVEQFFGAGSQDD